MKDYAGRGCYQEDVDKDVGRIKIGEKRQGDERMLKNGGKEKGGWEIDMKSRRNTIEEKRREQNHHGESEGRDAGDKKWERAVLR